MDFNTPCCLVLLQITASIEYVCATDTCVQSELFDLLKEMDRRYFLLQDLQWEFSMLDTHNMDSITEEQARYEKRPVTFTNVLFHCHTYVISTCFEVVQHEFKRNN